jgi:hypothetical protein
MKTFVLSVLAAAAMLSTAALTPSTPAMATTGSSPATSSAPPTGQKLQQSPSDEVITAGTPGSNVKQITHKYSSSTHQLEISCTVEYVNGDHENVYFYPDGRTPKESNLAHPNGDGVVTEYRADGSPRLQHRHSELTPGVPPSDSYEYLSPDARRLSRLFYPQSMLDKSGHFFLHVEPTHMIVTVYNQHGSMLYEQYWRLIKLSASNYFGTWVLIAVTEPTSSGSRVALLSKDGQGTIQAYQEYDAQGKYVQTTDADKVSKPIDPGYLHELNPADDPTIPIPGRID